MKAPKLQRGDTVGIVSPSWGGAARFPHRLERGIEQLETLGFRVKVGLYARNEHGFVSDIEQNRVADLHAMFRDPEVKAIIATIGGDHSCHLLPLLDFNLIRSHPKIFMGYSDITVLNVAIWKETTLTTYNGPALLTDFAEYPHLFDYTQSSFLRTLTEAKAIGAIEPSPTWTEEFLDWGERKDLVRARQLQPSEGWKWLKEGSGEGRLVGGCLESLQHLRGTRFWPDWNDTILFFETSEEKPSPETIDAILMDYENMCVFQQIKGLLVGRPMYYTLQEKEQLHEILLERTQKFTFPIITEMDFGHTAPQFIIPIGCRARIDSELQRFAIIESAVVD